jgi:hypothetical protein
MAGTTSSGASNAMSEIEKSLKRGSGDVGWEYGQLIDPTNLDKVKCKLCDKVLSGGIYRLKQHIGLSNILAMLREMQLFVRSLRMKIN